MRSVTITRMKSSYYLISKTITPFTQYTGKAIKLSNKTPQTIEEVLIGKKGKLRKIITTFRDKDGKIIERCFDDKTKPLRNRIYSYTKGQISENEFVNTTTIKEYTLKRQFIDVYHKFKKNLQKHNITTTLWNHEQTQTNYFAEDALTKTKTLTITRNTNLKKANGQFLHSITQYHQLFENVINKFTPIKHLEYVVTPYLKVVKNSLFGQGVKLPKNDTFLGFRILPLDDIRIPLTQRFLKERKIDNLGYKIFPDYESPTNEEITWKGLFVDGKIKFSKKWKAKTKADFVSTSRHEVEHGWQYFLDARNGGKRGEEMQEIGEKFGKITDPKLKAEADLYTEALNNYVPAKVDYEKYKNNYIEVRAYDEGAKAKDEYNKQGEIIRKDFKHIPPEEL